MRPRGPSRRRMLAMGLGLMVAGGSAVCGVGNLTARASDAPAVFHRGINTWPWFSLTREYPAPRTDYAWPPFQENRAVPTPADLARLTSVGFDFIRIPVDPGPFLDADPENRTVLMTSLLDAVRAARDAGLGVVVNLQPNEATHYWRSQNLISSPYAREYHAYLELVGAVAGELGRLRMPRLALEPVNEPPQACSSADWSDVQVALLKAARDAAPDLTLVATGACGSMVSGLQALDPKPLTAFEPLLFTFHFYEPYLFSHQGAPWMREPVYRSLNAVPWPGAAGSLDKTLAAVRQRMAADTGLSIDAKQQAYVITQRLMAQYFDANPDHHFIDHYLDFVSTWAEANAIPTSRILMGEFGALNTTGRYVAAHPDDRVRYIRDVRQSAEARGFPWAFWNLFDGMGLMDDTTRALDPEVIRALGLLMPPT